MVLLGALCLLLGVMLMVVFYPTYPEVGLVAGVLLAASYCIACYHE